ncbi:MAG: hypothetical protein ACREIV_06050, partial [Planctomycetaceae bacterium]
MSVPRMLLVVAAVAPAVPAAAAETPARFAVEHSGIVLTDVPIGSVTVTALDRDGNVLTEFNGQVPVDGLLLTRWDASTGRDLPQELPAFTDGILHLETDLAEGGKVYVTAGRIVVNPGGAGETVLAVQRTWRWWSLLPPLLAVVLAIVLRDVLVALLAAVWSGAVIITFGDAVQRGVPGELLHASLRTLDRHVLGQLTG